MKVESRSSEGLLYMYSNFRYVRFGLYGLEFHTKINIFTHFLLQLILSHFAAWVTFILSKSFEIERINCFLLFIFL